MCVSTCLSAWPTKIQTNNGPGMWDYLEKEAASVISSQSCPAQNSWQAKHRRICLFQGRVKTFGCRVKTCQTPDALLLHQ